MKCNDQMLAKRILYKNNTETQCKKKFVCTTPGNASEVVMMPMLSLYFNTLGTLILYDF